MIDCDAAVRAFLAAKPALFVLTGTRIYASMDLPAGYTPDSGAALLFSARGGGQDYSSKVLSPSYTFRCYAATEAAARALSQTLYDALNDRAGGKLKYARLENIPTLLSEPSTGWPFMLAFYRILIGN